LIYQNVSDLKGIVLSANIPFNIHTGGWTNLFWILKIISKKFPNIPWKTHSLKGIKGANHGVDKITITPWKFDNSSTSPWKFYISSMNPPDQ